MSKLTRHPISLEEFACDSALGGFVEASPAQRAAMRMLDGLPPANAVQRDACAAMLGRPWGDDLLEAKRVAALVMGADSGKSLISGLYLLHRALFASLAGLRAGQRGVALLVAPDTRLASIPLRYALGVCETSALVRAELEGEPTSDTIKFSRGTEITIRPATMGGRAVRGLRFVACVLEECAFFRDSDAVVNDLEIVRAVRPRLLADAVLLGVSTPYRKGGWLWDLFRKEHGSSKRALVLQAPTELMRPDKAGADLAEQYEDDPVSAAAELGAQFLDDVSTLIDAAALEAVTVMGRRELPPVSAISYRAFVDPSGGRSDAFTLAIAHAEPSGRVVIDTAHAWKPPLNPSGVVAEAAVVLKAYRVASVKGDRYGGEWPREAFRAHGIKYEVAEKPKSEIYLEFVPLVNSCRVELLDSPELLRQLRGLDRRRGPAGKDRVDHRPGAHDDLANAVAGVAVEFAGARSGASAFIEYLDRQIEERAEMTRRGFDCDNPAARAEFRRREQAGTLPTPAN